MGSFLGHIVPGTFFITFALWWMYNIMTRYLLCRRLKPHSYRNSTTYFCSCCKTIPLEPILKVGAASVGILGEFITAFENGKFAHWGNMQHITMFAFFGFNGVIDLLLHKRWLLPPNSDYVSAALSYAVEGFLFFYHLHGRTHMDIQIHMFLFYSIMACVVSTLAEMFQPTNVMPALCRVYFTLLQGTWFYQIAFILYAPSHNKWDEDDHTQMMIVTMIFTWHMGAILVFLLGFGSFIWLRVRNYSSSSLPMYQLVDTNVPSKEIYDAAAGSIQPSFKTNGHVHFDKSTDPSLHHILDSDSEEASM